MNKTVSHFKTITKHKFYVMKFCFKCHLFKRGLLHDLSKYSPIEFCTSVKYYTGNRSPIDNEKDVKGYSLAWQHHKGHNPHHWEYWIDNVGTRENKAGRIPYNYVVEMICDWLAAGIVYSKKNPDYNEPYDVPRKYYNAHTHERIFHKDTQKLIEFFLDIIARDGINDFCRVAREKKLSIIKNYLNKEVS